MIDYLELKEKIRVFLDKKDIDLEIQYFILKDTMVDIEEEIMSSFEDVDNQEEDDIDTAIEQEETEDEPEDFEEEDNEPKPVPVLVDELDEDEDEIVQPKKPIPVLKPVLLPKRKMPRSEVVL